MHKNRHRKSNPGPAITLPLAPPRLPRDAVIEAVARDMGLDLSGVLLRQFGQKIWDEAMRHSGWDRP